MTFHIPDAVFRIQSAIDSGIMRRGTWGDGVSTVCMMSALQPGATNDTQCATAGWPKWLSILCHTLFDRDVGNDPDATAFQFALDVADAIHVPRDYDRALGLFLIATLEGVLQYDKDGVVQPVINLLQRKLDGENVAGELKKARAAADAAAAYAAAAADAAAAYAAAAADAAYAAAADAAAAAAAYADAAYAADAAAAYAADAAYAAAADAAAAYAAAAADADAAAAAYAAAAEAAAAYAAYTAADAAARKNLMAALIAS